MTHRTALPLLLSLRYQVYWYRNWGDYITAKEDSMTTRPPLTTEELAELRFAIELAVPTARAEHPCAKRCFRVGGPCDISSAGVCPECGMTMLRRDHSLVHEIARGRPELLLALLDELATVKGERDQLLASGGSSRDQ